MNFVKYHWIYHFKMGNFILCEFFLSSRVIEKDILPLLSSAFRSRAGVSIVSGVSTVAASKQDRRRLWSVVWSRVATLWGPLYWAELFASVALSPSPSLEQLPTWHPLIVGGPQNHIPQKVPTDVGMTVWGKEMWSYQRTVTKSNSLDAFTCSHPLLMGM